MTLLLSLKECTIMSLQVNLIYNLNYWLLTGTSTMVLFTEPCNQPPGSGSVGKLSLVCLGYLFTVPPAHTAMFQKAVVFKAHVCTDTHTHAWMHACMHTPICRLRGANISAALTLHKTKSIQASPCTYDVRTWFYKLTNQHTLIKQT